MNSEHGVDGGIILLLPLAPALALASEETVKAVFEESHYILLL
jgi:hypothetical protein